MSFRLALVLWSAGVAGLQRLYAMPGHDAIDVWLGFAVAITTWGWLCAIDHGVARLAPPVARVIVSVGLAAVFYVSLCAELAYTYFYSVAEDRELSLLSIGVWEGLRVLVGELLPPRGLLLLGSFLVFAHVAAALSAGRGPAISRSGARTAYGSLAALTLATLVGGAKIDERIRSPLADLARELVFLATTPKLDLATAPKLPFDVRTFDKATPDDLAQSYAFDNVLVFVMETMITRDFAAEGSRLPADTFVRSAEPHVHRYTGYHGNNQDSRTGMLDMLESRVIPYEAYADGVRHYEFVARLPSLVDRFNARGYETAYAVSHADRESVVADLPWKQVMLLPREEVDRIRGKLLCVTVYEFEYGCEDRAILPKVLDLLDRHPKVFLFQEFIWGHDPEYNETSGRTNADYYSSYLDAVVAHLRQTGKLDRTLIVLTSDHGYRGRSTLGENYAYRIPLWFYATRFDGRENDRLFSHIDFVDLLLHEMNAVAPPERADPFVAVVGPTGIDSLTILDAAGELVLIRTRGNAHFLLAHRPAPGRGGTTLNPASFAQFFEDYRNYFDGLNPRR
jgi:hypothetical protein